MAKMEPVRTERHRRTLMMGAMDALKDAISNGMLRPNERLVESELTRQLNISRTPLREALHRLEVEGYVRSIPTGGFIVSDFTAKQIKELYEVRQALEGFATYLACMRATKKQLDTIERAHKKMIKVHSQGDLTLTMRQDDLFHDELYGACGNEQLFAQVQVTRGYFFSRRAARLLSLDDWTGSIEMHQKIVDALRNRNSKLAQELIYEHIGRAMRISVERLGW